MLGDDNSLAGTADEQRRPQMTSSKSEIPRACHADEQRPLLSSRATKSSLTMRLAVSSPANPRLDTDEQSGVAHRLAAFRLGTERLL